MPLVPHPYDARRRVNLPDGLSSSGSGWILWGEAAGGLPCWACEGGLLQPMEARYCAAHGEERPAPHRVWHELTGGARPRVFHRALDLSPRSDGGSTPCLAGNVLVYLTESGRVVATDLLGDASVFLVDGVQQAALRLHRGCVIANLRMATGARTLSWDVRDLRVALSEGARTRGEPTSEIPPSLVGLPGARSKLHVGAGQVRLVVEHDPVSPELVERYRDVMGTPPGPWLIQVVANPEGPPVPFPSFRPQALHQVPVPLAGGLLLLGQISWYGALLRGAIVLPITGGSDGV